MKKITKIVYVGNNGIEYDSEEKCLLGELESKFKEIINSVKYKNAFRLTYGTPCITEFHQLLLIIDDNPTFFDDVVNTMVHIKQSIIDK